MSRNPSNFGSSDPERVTDFDEGRMADDVEKVNEGVEDFAARAKQRASQLRKTVSETVDQQRQNAARGLEQAAATVHDRAGELPGGERVVTAAHRIASGLETTATYLRENDLGDVRDQVVNVCRRHPVQALISAVAVGFLLGRSVKR